MLHCSYNIHPNIAIATRGEVRRSPASHKTKGSNKLISSDASARAEYPNIFVAAAVGMLIVPELSVIS